MHDALPILGHLSIGLKPSTQSDLFSDMVDAAGRMAAVEAYLFEDFRGADLLGAEVKPVSGEELEENFLH